MKFHDDYYYFENEAMLTEKAITIFEVVMVTSLRWWSSNGDNRCRRGANTATVERPSRTDSN